jgi:Icc-related predicted phosphoesterase
MSDGRVVTHPEGCISIDGHLYRHRGLLLAGLGGSPRYSRGRYQYTESEMWQRILALAPHLFANRLRYGRYLDILVTHSPPYGIHDAHDLPHVGFKWFLAFMRWFKPRYLLHGHTHIYRHDSVTQTDYHHTTVLNVYPYRIIEWDAEE